MRNLRSATIVKRATTLSTDEQAIIDRFYEKVRNSKNYNKLLQAMGMAQEQKRAMGSVAGNFRMEQLKNLRQALLNKYDELNNDLERSDVYKKRSGTFGLDSDDSENDEVDYKTYLDIIKKYSDVCEPFKFKLGEY